MSLLSTWMAILTLASLISANVVPELFDYIIVGGGTAGSALAARLSVGLPYHKILLLEAGPAAPDELRINVPGMRGSILYSSYDWNFSSIAQPGLGGRSIDVNRGKVLGGSSAMNYLCYDRAASFEYDGWEELGNLGWGWDAMSDAMVKSENFTGDDGDLHGTDGPIRTSYSRIVPEILDSWRPAVNSLGVPINDGKSLAGSPVGVMFQPTNIDVSTSNRSYSANTYLRSAKKNLTVRTNVRVAKVLLSGKPLVATGVLLESGVTIKARKEVILSSGSIQSPGLLELSGIGQKKILQKAGVKQLLELPGVGENYQDHLRTSNTYRLKPGYESFDPLIFEAGGAFATEQLDLWLRNEVSWYDMTTLAYSFLDWKLLGKKVNDVFTSLAKTEFASSTSVVDKKKVQHLSNPAVPQLELILEANYVGAAGYPGGRFMTIFSSIMHPMSRGSVHINATDPKGKPTIDLKYFNNEYDVRAVVEGARFARKVANTEPMRSVWEEETEPGPGVQSDAEFREFAVKTVNSFYHPVGTCAMLPQKDGGVVNPDLLVYGTANLRVVDASIIPIQMSGHIQTSVYGIAEIAAQKIIDAAR